MTSSLTIIFTLIILIIWSFILYKIRRRTRLLIIPAIVLFIVSFCLFFYGFRIQYPESDIVSTIINSAVDAIFLFLGTNGFWMHPETEYLSYIYYYCLNLCLAMSISVSISFVVSAFGTRIKARIRAASIDGKNDLHIFYGITSRAITLAKSIDIKTNEKDKFIFVDIPEGSSNDQEVSLSFFDILSKFLFISPRAHKILDATTSWCLSLSDDKEIKTFENTKITNLYHAISLTIKDGHNVTFYVMTDDTEHNSKLTHALSTEIQSIITREKYAPIEDDSANEENTKTSKFATRINNLLLRLSLLSPEDLVKFEKIDFRREKDKKPTIYTIIKRNGPYKNIDVQFPEVDIITLDPAYLSVQLLKKGVVNNSSNNYVHPINFMDIAQDKHGNNLGYVTSQFSSMVIGFGSTGTFALPYLYEYAAVPEKDGTQARFKCYVVDDRLDYLEGNYTINRPNVDFTSKISFLDIKPDSNDFWEYIKEKIDELNYIVLCLGDDNRQLKLATDLIKFAYTRRKNKLQNFVVLVRLYGENNSLIVDAIKSFNHRYHSKVENGRDILIPFGEQKDIFSYELISELKENKKAEQIFNYKNDELRKVLPSEDRKDDWRDRHFVWKEISKNPEETPQKMKDSEVMEHYWSEYNKARLDENQDISSTYFIPTIKMLSKRADGGEISEDVIEMLEKCEHLRSKAFLEMAGYRYGKKDDNVEMTSRELTEWEDLPMDMKKVHAACIKASLKENNPHEQTNQTDEKA